MKFYNIPIGTRFEYRDETYRKSGPLVAVREANGSQQLMMRSANVKPEVFEAGGAPEIGPGDSLPADRVEAAFDVFYQACEQLLKESGGAQSGPQQDEVRQRLRMHRRRFFEQLQDPGETR
jgi:hypothetical protein